MERAPGVAEYLCEQQQQSEREGLPPAITLLDGRGDVLFDLQHGGQAALGAVLDQREHGSFARRHHAEQASQGRILLALELDGLAEARSRVFLGRDPALDQVIRDLRHQATSSIWSQTRST